MKDQYFGDKRDYFKYDLMIFLAQNLSGIQRFTFIPMLTVNDSSGHGKKTEYEPARGDPTLHAFLQKCINERRRSVMALRTFFGQHCLGFQYCPYADELRFKHHEREAYFREIPVEYLHHVVILADPDNGLEIKSMRSSTGHRYIRCEEVKDIYLRMGESSVFTIFQYFPREQRQHYLRRRFQELQDLLQCPPPVAISDNEIAFITLTKSNEIRERVAQQLENYQMRLERLWVFWAS